MRKVMNKRSAFFAFATIAIVLIWLMFGWHKKLSLYLEKEDHSDELLHNENNHVSNSVDAHKEINKVIKNTIQKPILQAPRTGLLANQNKFTLDGKDITLLSGALHYFRVPQAYWKDRILKYKACGLNTIETYIPWNAHEPFQDVYEFNGNLNIEEFLRYTSDLGMYVILRPGPYICAEWEFGGLPSWLLRDQHMSVRSMYKGYIDRVEKYFGHLLPILAKYQYTNGGNVIAFQLENEYGSFYKDKSHIDYLKNLMKKHGITELLFTSDNGEGLELEMSEGVLRTANFQSIKGHLDTLAKIQPSAPHMVMEFWSGWFDTWNDEHHTLNDSEFKETLEQLFQRNVSVNFYMFHGGTNFGFMNGGVMQKGRHTADITSYDYNAPISESGELTAKYFIVKELIQKYFNRKSDINMPSNTIPCKAFKTSNIVHFVPLWTALKLTVNLKLHKDALNMEEFPLNNNNGQCYGYALYTTNVTLPQDRNSFNISGFMNASDRVQLFVNGVSETKMHEKKPNFHILKMEKHPSNVTLDVLIENGGRINWKNLDDQRKGMTKTLTVDGKDIDSWSVYPLEMTTKFIATLSSSQLWVWKPSELKAPGFYRTYFEVDKTSDTFVNMKGWQKGVVFVNGQNLGRYWQIGPQCTLYLPSTWLTTGKNEVIIFEEISSFGSISFESKAIWGNPKCDTK